MNQGEKMKRFSIVVGGVLSAFLISCGGGSDSGGDPASPPLSKAEFIEAGDDICTRVDRESAKFEDEYAAAAEKNDYQGVADSLEGVRSLVSDASQEFEAIEVTGGDSGVIDEYNATRAKGLSATQSLIDAYRAEDDSAIKTILADLASLTDEAQRLAREYGFKECGAT
ncbi:MAG: hypothetical protein IPK93_08470 [Solirubrobacterales bacterium]|nr:hypothetical protein [Solirubrobacterales bacterium]